MTGIHKLLANTVWLYLFIVGLWGLFRAIRGQGLDGNYLGSVAIGQVLIYVQAVLGAFVFMGGNRPTDGFMHWLYGAFSLFFLPFVYFVWLQGDDSNRGQWVMGFATLFMFGIALRSMTTGI